MFTIYPISYIKNDLLHNKQLVRNFPKSTSFLFDKLYLEIVTQIKTIEISCECILLDAVQSHNINKEFSNPYYWSEISEVEINKFWIFAENGQGDLWLFDDNCKVFFYDHDLEEISSQNFNDLGLNFEKWLQYAFLNKQFDEIEDEVTEENKIRYKERMKEISNLLLDNYPFEI